MGDPKKIQYEKPELIPFEGGVAQGAGQCRPMGSLAQQCNAGPSAKIHSCNPTGAMDGSCNPGSQASLSALFRLLFKGR